MPGVQAVNRFGPDTLEVSEPVTGGQLVAPTSNGMVGPASAGSTKWLGVAESDAMPASTDPSGTTAYGAPVLDISVPEPRVAVGRGGEYRLTYAAAANFGDLVVAAANGQVTSYTAGTTTFDQLVGQCRESDGVEAGAKGLTELRR